MRLKDKINLHEEDFAEISRILKLTSIKFNVNIMLLVKLSFDLIRQEEERVRQRITDIGEAIIVERFADVLMLINRENYYGHCPPDSDYVINICTKFLMISAKGKERNSLK